MLNQYYRNADVRQRMLEYLGGSSLEESSCVYVTGDDSSADVQYAPQPTAELWQCLEAGLDVGRSLWDRRWLIAHLDIEYVNFDQLGEAYLDVVRCFETQKPVLDAATNVFRAHGIEPLRLLSGRGAHLVWKIDQASEAFDQLASLGHVAETLTARYQLPQAPSGDVVGEPLGRAFAGLGQVMEFVAHRMLRAAQPSCAIPVQLTAVECVPGPHGREVVSIDISEYGDPLFARGTRIPFSAYLKPLQQRWALGDALVDRLPRLFLIPWEGLSDKEGLWVMRSAERTAEWAGACSAEIPDMSAPALDLIAAYAQSQLARVHENFYACNHDPPESWPDTYDRTPMEPLPACVRALLQCPNDRLAKPAGIQLVVRALMAAGWHPRHIAGLIRSKFERDYGWGTTWYRYDASTRADFYTRLFAGLVCTGVDPLLDFNCVATQRKGYCSADACDGKLSEYQQVLLARCANE